MKNLQHIRSMAEMILKEVDELDGKIEPTPYAIGQKLYRDGLGYSDIWSAVKCDADINGAHEGYMDAMRESNTKPKAKLRKFAVGETVYYLNCAGDEVEAIVVDVHQYDLDRYMVESCGLYTCWMTEKLLSGTPRSKTEERVWHSGPPPHVGWWNASRNKNMDTWRWWNGMTWSGATLASNSPAMIEQLLSERYDCRDMEWCDYWPENARMPRINPAWHTADNDYTMCYGNPFDEGQPWYGYLKLDPATGNITRLHV